MRENIENVPEHAQPSSDRAPATATANRRPGQRGRSRRPRLPLDVDRIVDAAIAIADRDGVDAMTMRNVAAALGVGVMSLYWYVPTKNDLELLIRERILLEDSEGDQVTGDLRHDLAQLARGLRDKIRRHPWVLDAWSRVPDYSSTAGMGGELLGHIEISLRIVDDTPLSFEEKAGVIAIVDHYALGFAMDEATAGRVVDQERGGSINDHFGTSIDEAEYPLLSRYLARSKELPDVDTRFEWGLHVLLNGIEVQVERARVATQPTAVRSPSCQKPA